MKHKHLLIVLTGLSLVVGCGMPVKVRQAQDLETQGQLTKAADLYREALAQMSAGEQRKTVEGQLNQTLAKITDQTLAEATSARGSGGTIDECDRGLAVLTAKAAYDDAERRVAGALAAARRQRQDLVDRRKALIEQADLKVRRGQWAQAYADLRQAGQIQGDADLVKKQAKILADRDADYRKRIDQACTGDDWEKAAALFHEFANQQPAPDAGVATALDGQVKGLQRRIITRKVQTLQERRRFFTGYTLLLDSKVSGCDELLRAVRRAGGKYYLQAGKKELAKQRLFHAYVAALKAKILDPQEDEIFKFHRDCEDKVDPTIHVQVGIATFNSPTKEPEAGVEFSNSLISYLNHTRPYGIDIVERAKIDQAMKEKERNLNQAAQLLGTQLFLVGNVSTLTVDKQQSQREISQKVKVGSDTVSNPVYEDFCRRYGANNKDNWPHIPPATVEKDRFDLVKFKRGEARMEGVMTVSVRIFTTDKGAITQADTFTAKEEVRDTFQDGVPEAGIKDKSLELPTELAMKQNLRTKLVKDVAAWVLKNFECRQGRYCAEAGGYLERREPEKAVQALAQGYLYCLRDNVPDKDEWFQKIRKQVLFDLTEPAE